MNFGGAQIAWLCVAAIVGLTVLVFIVMSVLRKELSGVLHIIVVATCLFVLFPVWFSLVSARSRFVTHNIAVQLTNQGFTNVSGINANVGTLWMLANNQCWLQVREKKVHNDYRVFLDRGDKRPVKPLTPTLLDQAGRSLC